MKFPEGFYWGAATSAHQVEGNQQNNWSEWEPTVAERLAETAEARLKEKVLRWELIKGEAKNPDNYISGKAADHYNRFEEDFDYMKELGLNAYRFSIEWSRIEPEPGLIDQEELDHYHEVINSLRQRSIEPFICLHHFSDPEWVEEMGGWSNKDVVDHYVRYVKEVIFAFDEYCDYWFTFNEANSYLLSKYLGGGIWADWPNAEFNPLRLLKALKNMSEAHRRAYEVIKKHDNSNKVGHDHGIVIFDPARKDPITLLFTKLTNFMSRLFPKKIQGYEDILGIHYYVKVNMKAKLTSPQKWVEHTGQEKTDFGWGIYPEGIYEVTQRLKKKNLPIFITENGLADAEDALRQKFIYEHIKWIHKSIEDGADIRSYFYWSLLDNFEWSEGFWPKFGLIEVDKETQQRSIRDSALRYAEIIKSSSY